MKDYIGLPVEYFKMMTERHAEFQKVLNDDTSDPVQVFDPLSEKSLTELALIREISKELQAKKDKDIKKSVAADTVKPIQETEIVDEKTEVAAEKETQ